MNPFRPAALALVLLAGPAVSQPKKGAEVYPDRLPLGTVHTGATVEFSLMIRELGNNPDIKLDVTAPKFVRVLKQETSLREGPHVYGDVDLSLDTSAAGELGGEVVVTLGKTTAKVPLAATVRPRRPGRTRLLVADTPFSRSSTSDATEFEAWTELVKAADLDVDYLLVTGDSKPVLRDLDLGKFDTLLLSMSGLAFLTPGDAARAKAFAEAGGRVAVAGHCFNATVEPANSILAGYGLEVRDIEARPGQNVIGVGADDLAPEVQKAGIASAHFFRPAPVAVSPGRGGRVLVRAVGVGQPGDGFVAAAKAGRGEVVAVGQAIWWWWISHKQAKGSDNAKLLRLLLAPPKGP